MVCGVAAKGDILGQAEMNLKCINTWIETKDSHDIYHLLGAVVIIFSRDYLIGFSYFMSTFQNFSI
jgi:hypothetical protein